MPSKVCSQVGIGKCHDIEVEDDVTCYMEFGSGMTGTFITSTGETPGSNRFELAGTKGRLLLENDKLELSRILESGRRPKAAETTIRVAIVPGSAAGCAPTPGRPHLAD